MKNYVYCKTKCVAFLICFYNPNKFVSHTPRLEKGAVRQFRIAVCSQLRQGICCKAVAANKCWFSCCAAAPPAPLRSPHGTEARKVTRSQEPRGQQPHVPASPPLTRTRWPCWRLCEAAQPLQGHRSHLEMPRWQEPTSDHPFPHHHPLFPHHHPLFPHPPRPDSSPAKRERENPSR